MGCKRKRHVGAALGRGSAAERKTKRAAATCRRVRPPNSEREDPPAPGWWVGGRAGKESEANKNDKQEPEHQLFGSRSARALSFLFLVSVPSFLVLVRFGVKDGSKSVIFFFPLPSAFKRRPVVVLVVFFFFSLFVGYRAIIPCAIIHPHSRYL